MLKIAVIDEDLPRIIGAALAGLGWQVMDVRDYGLRGKNDREIFGFAQESMAVLFSADWGFANILQFPPPHHGIVILHFPNEVSTGFVARETAKALIEMGGENFENNLIIIEPGRVRMRRK